MCDPLKVKEKANRRWSNNIWLLVEWNSLVLKNPNDDEYRYALLNTLSKDTPFTTNHVPIIILKWWKEFQELDCAIDSSFNISKLSPMIAILSPVAAVISLFHLHRRSFRSVNRLIHSIPFMFLWWVQNAIDVKTDHMMIGGLPLLAAVLRSDCLESISQALFLVFWNPSNLNVTQ